MSNIKELWLAIVNGSPALRKEICKNNPRLFMMYYFPEYFVYKTPKFHLDFFQDCKDLTNGAIDEAMWCVFREGAKRQPLDAKILTPRGWTTMGDIYSGDFVIGSDGKPTMVVLTSPIVNRPVYEVTTEDGRKTQCDIDHLWTVRKMTNVKNKYVTMSLKEILDSGISYKRKLDPRTGKSYIEYKYAIDTVKPIEFNEKSYLLDPYFFGLWLGDGTSCNSNITKPDKEIEDYLSTYAKKVGLEFKVQKHAGKRTQTMCIVNKTRGGSIERFSLAQILRKLKVLNNKHIPQEYLEGSISQRRELLEGLMDTDGTVGQHGTAVFSNTNEELIDGVVNLVRSLGGRANKMKQQTYFTYKGKRKAGLPSWRVSMLFTDYTPFKLTRKKILHKKSSHSFSRIIDIKEIGNKEGKCIKVSNADGLYVTDDYLLTHNTSIAKTALLVWAICFQKKNYIGWDSYDGDNSESALFDATVSLQTNPRIIADFGHLYYKKKEKTALVEAKLKRIKNFITEPSQYGPGVKVIAITTQESIRGLITGADRLDMVIFDDFENNKTKDSPVITNKIIAHMDEYRTGMPAGASALYLCNYLTDSGSVANIMDKLRDNPRARVRFVPVKDEQGVIAWPDKYVDTMAEAYEINKTIANPRQHKISLEAKKAQLSKDGLLYETEFMLNPSKSGDLFFDRKKVDDAIKSAQLPIEENASLKVWERFNPRNRYGGGADTAEGIGGDHNASVWIDFTSKPNKVVATFQDNMLSNTLFGWELKRQGGLYGFPFLVPEINNTGYGTVAELLNAEYPRLYLREQKNKQTGKIQKEFGWKATIGTIYEALSALKEAFESGELEILDKDLLTEMRHFTKANARIMGNGRQKGVTKHFDKLRATALAWEARRWAELTHEEVFDQPEYEGSSEFEGYQNETSESSFFPSSLPGE